jgi:hypothetical protein
VVARLHDTRGRLTGAAAPLDPARTEAAGATAARTRSRPSLREPVAVWLVFAATSAATVVTYARLPAEELWNVSGSGLVRGLSRVLVHLNFPVSLVAIAVVLVSLERLRSRLASSLGGLAIVFCIVTAVPGVVRADDLDARWVNAVPALGVALAAGLTVAALRRGGLGNPAPGGGLDAARLALGAIVLVVSLPWLAALLGFYLDGPYFSSPIVQEPGHPDLAAVHLGLHHGLDGALVATAALLLSRLLSQLEPGGRRSWLVVYLSLMLVYGLANVVQDAWLEQLYKRGWVDAKLPELTTPDWNAGWAVVLVISGALATVVLYRLAHARGNASAAARVSV